MISRDEILKNREKEFPLSSELEANLSLLLQRVNKLRLLWAKPMIVTSGYRPGRYNKAAGGAEKSAHLTCQAVDISDPKGEIGLWLFNNIQILKDCGLWMEHPGDTPTWCHLQTVPPKSGVRIFRAKPPKMQS
jgi:hypothetical protein